MNEESDFHEPVQAALDVARVTPGLTNSMNIGDRLMAGGIAKELGGLAQHLGMFPEMGGQSANVLAMRHESMDVGSAALSPVGSSRTPDLRVNGEPARGFSIRPTLGKPGNNLG